MRLRPHMNHIALMVLENKNDSASQRAVLHNIDTTSASDERPTKSRVFEHSVDENSTKLVPF